MKRVKLTIILFFTFAATFSTLAQPALQCLQPDHDFGDRYSDEIIAHDFVIENSGSEPLQLEQPHAHCGCTDVVLEKSTIAPGERTTITAVVDLHGKEGMQRVSVVVSSNDTVTPELELALAANVIPNIDVNPSSVDFGSIPRGEDKSYAVRLTPAREGIELGVKDIHVPSSMPCRATFQPEDDGGGKLEIVLVSNSPHARGYFGGEIKVHLDRPREQFLSIAVTGEIVHEVRIHPPTLRISSNRVPGRSNPPLYMRVLPGSTETFSITGIELPVDGATIDLYPDSSGGYIIRLADLPPVKILDGKSIELLTDIETSARISIPIKTISPDG